MENYNIELLNKTYNRIVNILEKHSNLKISIGGDVNDINSDFTEIYILKEHSSSLIFKASLKSTEEDNKYSFLFSHKCSYRYKYNDCSIFKFAERCRNFYQYRANLPNKYLNIGYELCSSEAGKIIKELGFPCCIEELNIKMDLLGV